MSLRVALMAATLVACGSRVAEDKQRAAISVQDSTSARDVVSRVRALLASERDVPVLPNEATTPSPIGLLPTETPARSDRTLPTSDARSFVSDSVDITPPRALDHSQNAPTVRELLRNATRRDEAA